MQDCKLVSALTRVIRQLRSLQHSISGQTSPVYLAGMVHSSKIRLPKVQRPCRQAPVRASSSCVVLMRRHRGRRGAQDKQLSFPRARSEVQAPRVRRRTNGRTATSQERWGSVGSGSSHTSGGCAKKLGTIRFHHRNAQAAVACHGTRHGRQVALASSLSIQLGSLSLT